MSNILFSIILLFFALMDIFTEHVSYPIKDVKYYQKCFESLQHNNEIQHFPKVIPSMARDIKLYCYPGRFEHDSELVLLLLKANPDYIQKELNTHSFKNRSTPIGAKQNIYHMPSNLVGIDMHDLTYYVLKNKSNFSENDEYFPYFTGVGVSSDKNTILYYYIKPD